MNRRFCLIPLLAAISVCFLVGCGLKHDVQQSKIVSERFLEDLQSAQNQLALAPSDTNSPAPPANQAIASEKVKDLCAHLQQTHGSMKSWKLVRFYSALGGTKFPRHTVLTYQIQWANSRSLAKINLEPVGKTSRITGFEFQ